MGGDAIGSLMTLLTFLLVLGGSFFLAYGLWEVLLKPLFSEAKELEDRSTLKAMRRVVLRKMAVYNRRVVWPRYEKRISRKVMNAGGLSGLTPEEFMSMQQISCLGFAIFGLILINFLRKNVGLDFQAAVGTVGQKGKQGPLVEECELMLKHLRVGKTREEALRMMADRVGLPQLSSFIAALIQADRMGTSLGKVLRIQSTQMRIERTQRAEKLANEAPVKMLFPLIACIFPTVFMVLFGPIVFQFMTGEF
jgi:tight adherence protein C